MDHFAISASGERADRRHGRGHPGPADRHQHHGPGSSRTALRVRRRVIGVTPAMTLATVQTAIGYVVLFLVFMLCVVYGLASMRSGQGRSGLRGRHRAEPQAVLRRSHPGDRSSRPGAHHGVRGAGTDLPRPAAVLAPRARPQGQRRARPGRHLPEAGRGAVREQHAREPRRPRLRRSATATTGTGGVASYTITDSDGRYIQQVNWKAPALDSATLRFSRLRPPLHHHLRPAVLADGGVGGRAAAARSTPSRSRTSSPSSSRSRSRRPRPTSRSTAGLAAEKAAAKTAGHPYKSDGEALFNLGYYADVSGGAYSCGRCHTQGWSYGQKGIDGGRRLRART